MGISGSALITALSKSRGAYNEGQQEGQANAKKDQLSQILMMRKMQQEEEAQRLAQSLGQANLGKIGAETERLRRPEQRNIDPNSPELLDRKNREAQEMAKLVAALRPKQEATARGPVRGTPEYLAARKAELDLESQYKRDPAEPAPKAPTEAQEKSHLFYNLMSSAEPEILAAMGSKKIRPAAISAYLASNDASSIPVVGRLIGGLATPAVNSQLNADEQRLIRAGKDFTAGVKRKESGAAVSSSELMETMERYFPGMFGDKPELTESKNAARKSYMETMKLQAVPATDFYGKKEGAKGGATASSLRVKYDAAAKHLKAQGKSDADVRSMIGEPPGDEE